MPLDIFDFINILKAERYRAAIIHTTPDLSPSLSTFCRKFAEQTNGKYLDLLDHFIQSPGLSEIIDKFGPEKLVSLLIDQARTTQLLIVDRADFLLDTWTRFERQNFYRLIKNQWDGYKDGMKTGLIFSLQTSPEIEVLPIIDSQGNQRVLRLSDFNDIP